MVDCVKRLAQSLACSAANAVSVAHDSGGWCVDHYNRILVAIGLRWIANVRQLSDFSVLKVLQAGSEVTCKSHWK